MIASPAASSGASSSITLPVTPGGHHQPHRARCVELGDEIGERRRRGRALRRERGAGRGVVVVHDALVAGRLEPAHDVGAHAPEADHAELHHASVVVAARERGADDAGEIAELRDADLAAGVDVVDELVGVLHDPAADHDQLRPEHARAAA